MVMSKPLLKLAPRGKPGPSYALVRKACRLFKGSYGPRAERHANIRKWLSAVDAMGNRHILKGGEIGWGMKTKGIQK